MAKSISNKSRKILWNEGQIPRRIARAEKMRLKQISKDRKLGIRS